MNLKRRVLDQIRNLSESTEPRTARAERVADLIRGTGAYRWVGIYAVKGDEIACVAWSGPNAPAHARFSVHQGLCGAAVRCKAVVMVGDVTKDPRYLTTFSSTRSEIVVPIIHPVTRAALGVIDVESERVNAFTDDDRAFLEECASVLASLYD